jgi:hypothetical protein
LRKRLLTAATQSGEREQSDREAALRETLFAGGSLSAGR